MVGASLEDLDLWIDRHIPFLARSRAAQTAGAVPDYPGAGTSAAAQVLHLGPSHFERAVGMIGTPQFQEQYDPMGEAALRRHTANVDKPTPGAAWYDPSDTYMGPWKRAVGEFAVQWYSPANPVIGHAAEAAWVALKAGYPAAAAAEYVGKTFGAKLGEAVMKAAQKVPGFFGRTYPAADAASATVDAAARATKAGFGKAAMNVVRNIPTPLRTVFDRYWAAGLPQRGGSRYVGEALAMQAAPQHYAAQVVNKIRDLGRGLTPQQKIEVGKLLYTDKDGKVEYERDRANVPEPKGMSLEDRAAAIRYIGAQTDQWFRTLRIRDEKTGTLRRTGTYVPFRLFKDRFGRPVPVFRGQDPELNKLLQSGDETKIARYLRSKSRGSPKFSSRAGGKRHQTVGKLTDPLVEQDLHPDFDLFFQLEKHYDDAWRAIAIERRKIMLEHLPSIDPATGLQRVWEGHPYYPQPKQTARMPILYELPPDARGGIQTFGVGTAGRKSMEAAIRRRALGEALEEVRSTPAMQQFARTRGIDPDKLDLAFIRQSNPRVYQTALKELKRMGKRQARGLERLVATSSVPYGEALILRDAIAKAREARQTAREAFTGVQEARQAVTEATPTVPLPKVPGKVTNRSVERLARDLHQEATAWEREQFEALGFGYRADETKGVAESATKWKVPPKRGGGIIPPLVWRAKTPGGPLIRYTTDWAEEWEKTSLRRYLAPKRDWPTKPPEDNTHPGTIDDVADAWYHSLHGDPGEDPVRALIEFMEQHPRGPTPVSEFHDEARSLLTRSAEREQEERAAFTKAQSDLKAAQIAHKAAVAAVKQAGRTPGPVRSAARRTLRAAKIAMEKATATIDRITAAQHEREKALTDKLLKTVAASQTAAEFARRVKNARRRIFSSIAPEIRDNATQMPKGYVRETDLGLSSPSGDDMALEEAWFDFMKPGVTMGVHDVAELKDAQTAWRMMAILNRLARAGIVIFPNVHGFNNLTMHYLAAGAQYGATWDSALEIITGRRQYPGPLKRRAYAAGAATESSQSMFEFGAGPNVTTNVSERATRFARKHFGGTEPTRTREQVTTEGPSEPLYRYQKEEGAPQSDPMKEGVFYGMGDEPLDRYKHEDWAVNLFRKSPGGTNLYRTRLAPKAPLHLEEKLGQVGARVLRQLYGKDLGDEVSRWLIAGHISGNVPGWEELSPEGQQVLRDLGLVNREGHPWGPPAAQPAPTAPEPPAPEPPPAPPPPEEEAPSRPTTAADAFEDLNEKLHGAPARAADEVQKVAPGLLTSIVDDVQDLIQQMSARWGPYDVQRDYVVKRIDSLLQSLESVERLRPDAVAPNMRVNDALKKFAAEHAALPAYNEPQWKARYIATLIGNKDWASARLNLEKLRALTEEDWQKEATAFKPDYMPGSVETIEVRKGQTYIVSRNLEHGAARVPKPPPKPKPEPKPTDVFGREIAEDDPRLADAEAIAEEVFNETGEVLDVHEIARGLPRNVTPPAEPAEPPPAEPPKVNRFGREMEEPPPLPPEPESHLTDLERMNHLSAGELLDAVGNRAARRAGFDAIIEPEQDEGQVREFVDLGAPGPQTFTFDKTVTTPGTLSPLARVVKPIAEGALRTGQGYQGMNHWLFNDVEQGLSIDLFDKFTRAGIPDHEAALRVREAMSRFDNLAPNLIEEVNRRMFYFYPWIKTAVPFWIKMGLFDPKWWVAPVEAIRVQNQASGYDDPSQPFTATFGKRATGEWRRYQILIPQRVIEPIVELGRAPLDLATLHPAEAGEDLKAPINYVLGHLNVFGQLLKDTILTAYMGPTRTAPFNVLHVDPHKSGRANVVDIGGRLLNTTIAPLERIEGVFQDPVAAAAALVTGGTTYGTKTQEQQQLQVFVRGIVGQAYSTAMVDKAIERAKAAGNQQLVDALQAVKDDPRLSADSKEIAFEAAMARLTGATALPAPRAPIAPVAPTTEPTAQPPTGAPDPLNLGNPSP